MRRGQRGKVCHLSCISRTKEELTGEEVLSPGERSWVPEGEAVGGWAARGAEGTSAWARAQFRGSGASSWRKGDHAGFIWPSSLPSGGALCRLPSQEEPTWAGEAQTRTARGGRTHGCRGCTGPGRWPRWTLPWVHLGEQQARAGQPRHPDTGLRVSVGAGSDSAGGVYT